MSSLFTCQPIRPEPVKTCMFRGLSQCRDHVSHRICNAHAAIFGITYKMASFEDGNNDRWTKIVTYLIASNSLNIPLFIDQNRKVLLNEINTFSMNAANNIPNIKAQQLHNMIACYMGINPSVDKECCERTWLDEPGNELTIRNNNGLMEYLQYLPPLHKYLFYYMTPSQIHNVKTNTTVYLVPHVSLTQSDTADTFAFVIPNKSCVLKYNDKPDCIATPLVIDGIRRVAHNNEDRTFQPMNNFNNLC